MMEIAIGSDHAGFSVKEHIKAKLTGRICNFNDYGAYSEEPVDYPDVAHPIAKDVESGKYKFGILMCGSGNGVAITANKYKGIRAALCWNEETVRLARQHNDANILVIPARFLTPGEAAVFAEIFLETEFEGGRHSRRVEKITGTL